MRHAVDDLRRLEIDYGEGPNEGPTDLAVETTTNRRDNSANAGDDLTLTVRVTNRGRFPVYRLRVQTKSDQFEAPLDLRPGVNIVTVIARENGDVAGRAVFVVRRDGPNGELLETPRHDGAEEFAPPSPEGDE